MSGSTDFQEVDRLLTGGAGEVDKVGDGFLGRFGSHVGGEKESEWIQQGECKVWEGKEERKRGSKE